MTKKWYDDIQGGDWVIIALLGVACVALICAVFSPQLTAAVSAVVSGAFGGASGYATRVAKGRVDECVTATDNAISDLRGLEALRQIEEGQHDETVRRAVDTVAADVADDDLDDLVSRANRIVRSVGAGAGSQ